MTRRERTFTIVLLSSAWLLTACAPALRPSVAVTSAEQHAAEQAAVNESLAAAAGRAAPHSGVAAPPESLGVQLSSAIEAAMATLGVDSALASSLDAMLEGGEVDEAVEVSWDLDVRSYLTEDRVKHYMDLFTGPASERISMWLSRGKRYEPMIREKFRNAGIPEDMYYLAMVESGYNQHAYSSAAAVGMWQFMTATAKGVGLRVDWWVDERRDPFKATDAAARFLTQLHRQFGSYYLAAAAYNGGPGRVSRGLAMYEGKMSDVEGEDRFFALAEESYLRKETRNYVPQLVAAALVGKEPHKYGLTVDSAPPITYDSVLVAPLTSISAVALATNVPLDVVKDLNPAYIRGVTPPGAYQSPVRLPVGTTVDFETRFIALSVDEREPFSTVAAKKGQTLAGIAKAHGVSTSTLAVYNRSLSTRKALRTGQSVLVPKPSVLVAARNVPDPAIERYGSVSTSAAGRRTHLVRRGENLGVIARRYRTSVATLRRLNGLKGSVVYAGQRIIVGGSPARRAATPAKKKVTTKAKATSKTPVTRKTPAKQQVARQ